MRRKDWMWVWALAAVFVVLGILAYNNQPNRLRCLGYIRPVAGWIEGSNVGTYYSFQGDIERFRDNATSELTRMGFKIRSQTNPFQEGLHTTFVNKDNATVEITSGKTWVEPSTTGNFLVEERRPGWVTVKINEQRSKNALSDWWAKFTGQPDGKRQLVDLTR